MEKTLKLILYKEDMTDIEWDKIDDFLGDLNVSPDVFEVDSRKEVEDAKIEPEGDCIGCYMWRDGCKFWHFESTAGYKCERDQGPLQEKPK